MHGNTNLELAWTVAPVLILAAIGSFVFYKLPGIEDVPSASAQGGRVDVRVEFDKNFDFKPVQTWGWNPAGPGEIKMARSQYADPDVMNESACSWITSAA